VLQLLQLLLLLLLPPLDGTEMSRALLALKGCPCEAALDTRCGRAHEVWRQ